MKGRVTRYDVMPIPPSETQTTWFDAGSLAFGVEYRLLNDAIAATHVLEDATGLDPSDAPVDDDSGVSIHVCDNQAQPRVEHLRFDCFVEDPHYHYISWKDRSNDMVHLDPIADGDPLSWTLERLRTRLHPMLSRAGAKHIPIDMARVEEVLPRVAEAAYRARYNHDDEAILKSAFTENAS
jgi:hypothetical protein